MRFAPFVGVPAAPWYDETQLELQLTNIRRVQHHTARALERYDIASTFDRER